MSEWTTASLNRLAEVQKGRQATLYGEDGKNRAPYLGATALDRTIRSSIYADINNAVIAELSDVLMLWDGERSGLVGKGRFGVVASTVSRLRPVNGMDARFLFHALQAKYPWIQARRTGTGVPHVPKDLATSLFLHYPCDQNEQANIAVALDTIDTAIQHAEALIAKLKQIRTGLLHDLVTFGIDENGLLRSHPVSWPTVPLGQLANVAAGVTLGRNLDGRGTVELPYMRVANVQDGYLDLSEIKTVRIYESELQRYALELGDVLMNEGGDADKLGRGTVWEGQLRPCLHQNHVFRVRTDHERLNPYFLALLCSSYHGKRYFLQNSKQSTNLASINSTQIKAFPVLLPLMDEQNAIVTRLREFDLSLTEEQQELAKLMALKQGLSEDLLTGRVRVPLELA